MNGEKGVLKVAGPFAPGDLDRLKAGLCRVIGREVEFTVVEDPSLLGGFAAYVGGRVYDASVLSQVKRLCGNMLESVVGGGSR